MNAVHPGMPGTDEWDPVFIHQDENIYLRCVDENDVHIGDLKIATAEAVIHANTLVNAANAGLRFMQNTMVDRAIEKMRADLPTTEEPGEGT
jgi:hypothetical protein